MFKTRTTRNHERALALIGMVSAVAGVAASGKGRGAERMEALAQVVAALGFDAESIKSVEIGWKKIYMDGSYELVPVLTMESIGGETKEIEQTERS